MPRQSRFIVPALLSLLALSLSILACDLPQAALPPSPTPTATPLYTPSPEAVVFTEIPFTPAPEAVVFTETPTPVASAAPNLDTPPDVIVILSPGIGSQVSNTLTVSGVAEPTFENMLAIEVVDTNGQVIGNGVASIHADANQRSPFDGTVTFTPPAQAEPGRIVVSDSSARDGHLTHLTSVEILLLPNGGTASLNTDTEQPEAIQIQSLAPGASLSRGTLTITGYAAPTFEQTLSVAILDESGQLVGSGPVTIQADAGQAGPFEGTITYTVTHEQPGSVQVYVASARDGGLTHLTSVDVTLQP